MGEMNQQNLADAREVMEGNNISKEDALFYLDMINSSYGPSYKPKIGQLKSY